MYEGVTIQRTAVVSDDCKIGKGTRIWHYANLYGCVIGEGCTIGGYVEIQSGAIVGNRVTISSHSFICDRVAIGDNAFIGHGVMTINDLFPPSKKRTGTEEHWKATHIGRNAVIGSNATLFPVRIGENAIVGAGSVIREDVPKGEVWAGNPARHIGYTRNMKYENGELVFKH